MNDVTDIVLICDLAEIVNDQYERLEMPPAVEGLNDWLKARDCPALTSLRQPIAMFSGMPPDACIYGAAYCQFDAAGFMRAVAEQPWGYRRAVLLLVRVGDDRAFAAYRLRPDGLIQLY